MIAKDFISRLRTSVVIENMAIYRDLFERTRPDKATDPCWKKALTFFGSLSNEEKEIFFQIIRQVSVDTTSNILGVLDGNSAVTKGDDVTILSDRKNEKINGDLQNLFLTEEEKAPK